MTRLTWNWYRFYDKYERMVLSSSSLLFAFLFFSFSFVCFSDSSMCSMYRTVDSFHWHWIVAHLTLPIVIDRVSFLNDDMARETSNGLLYSHRFDRSHWQHYDHNRFLSTTSSFVALVVFPHVSRIHRSHLHNYSCSRSTRWITGAHHDNTCLYVNHLFQSYCFVSFIEFYLGIYESSSHGRAFSH
jgi:hypothetical protein